MSYLYFGNKAYLIYSVFETCRSDRLGLDFYKCMKIAIVVFLRSRSPSVKPWLGTFRTLPCHI